MTPIDPLPYVSVYVVIVFLCPWLVLAGLIWRELRFARAHGIIVTIENWTTEWSHLKQFRQEDPQARHLYGLVMKWQRIIIVTWIIGFVVLGGALFALEWAGILMGPQSG